MARPPACLPRRSGPSSCDNLHRSNTEALRCATASTFPPASHRHARGRARPGARGRAAGAAFRDDRRPHRLPGRERVGLSLHHRPQASRRRRRAGDAVHPGRGGRRDRAAAAGNLRAGPALSQPGPDGEDGGLAGRPVRRPGHLGRRRGLAEGGVRGARQPRLRAARRRHRRMARDLQAAMDAVAGQLQRPVLPLRRHSRRALPRCRSRIRRYGSAAIPGQRCTAPRAMATAGIRSAPSPPRRCRRRRCKRIWRR